MSENKTKMSRRKRWALFGALLFFSFQLAVPALVAPQQANALLGFGDLSITIGDIPALIRDSVSKALKTAADVAFKNVLRSYLNDLAYQLAVQVATGEKGQDPQFITDPKDLLRDAADVAAGDILDTIASDWAGKSQCKGYPGTSCKNDSGCNAPVLMCPEGAPGDCVSNVEAMNTCLAAGCVVVQCSESDLASGTGLCNYDESQIPVDPKTKEPLYYELTDGSPQCESSFSLCEIGPPSVQIQLNVLARKALSDQEGGQASIDGRCPLTDIIDNFDDYRGAIGDAADANKLYLAEFSKTFNPEATQLGAYLKITAEAKKAGDTAAAGEELAANISGDINPITSTVSGLVKTPASLVRNALTSTFGASLDQYLVYTGSAVADAVGVFTNTLASKLIERYIFGLDPASSTGSGGRGLAGFFGGASPGVSAAKILFSDIKNTNYTVAGSADILSSLSSCPDSTDPMPDTCVMDNRLRTAIDQQLTVRQAIDQGLLDGNKVFGFDGDVEPDLLNGYPYRSLLIMRKYRIIPVGWELAAEYIRDFSSGTHSINTIMQDFNNAESPFYQLIDPNWVLKSPEAFCSRQGAGEKVISSTAIRNEDTNLDGKVDTSDAAGNVIQRQSDYCADEQTCLAENDDGSCKQYGYCIEEKAVWKFDGSACEEQFSSCQALSETGGGNVAYLLNTVDVNGCNSENAGCQWYCEDFSPASNSYTCNSNPPPGGGNKLSFSQNVSQCGESSEGCNEFIRTTNTGANYQLNSDFEQMESTPAGVYDNLRDSALPDEFPEWFDQSGCGVVPLGVTESFGGFSAVRLNVQATCGASNPGTPVEDGFYFGSGINTGVSTNNKTYTLSFYAKTADDDTDCNGTNGRLNADLMRVLSAANFEGNLAAGITATNSWTRYTGTVTFSEAAFLGQPESIFYPVFSRPAGDQCDVIIDEVQIEAGGLTNYKTYEQSAKSYLKKAPAYLGCTADLTTNNPLCNDYALECTTNEIGCEAYTSASTGRTITGVVSNPRSCDPNVPGSCDQCPADFVGCQAYREQPIERPPYRPARDPVSFVSTTGQGCPASAVGCEEYTNLEEVALGGEGKEYYSFVRMCVEADDADARDYYTWEGSNEFGFQLRQYDLKKSNLDDGPCTNIGAENDAVIQAQLGLNWPSCLDGFSVDRDGDGVNEEVYDAATCTAAEVGVNPDCTEFYDSGGNLYWVLKSRLIYADEECKSYRNTKDGPDMIYHMVPGEGISCQATYAGCRAYKGNAGDNTRDLYVEDFENGTVGSWIGSVSYSNEATNAGGHSMLVSNSGAINQAGSTLGFSADKTYTVSFWARSAVSSPTSISASFSSAPALTFPGQATADTNDWQQFELGPLYVPVGTDLSTVQLVLFSNNAFYIDNIRITEVFENIYLVQDSYTECSGYEGCDRYSDRDGLTHHLKSFTSLCDEQKVGCEVMIDTQNSDTPYATSHILERFLRGDMTYDSRLNQDDVDLLASQVASGIFSPLPAQVGDVNDDGVTDGADVTFLDQHVNASGPEPSPTYYFVEGTVGEDALSYLVYDSAKLCNASSQGCTRFGKPNLDGAGNAQSFDHTFLIDDPDRYVTDLCTFGESSCKEYFTPGGAAHYFKDPGNQVCEYKQLGDNPAGWYKKGTLTGAADCPTAVGFCSGGANEGTSCNSSDDCDSGFCNRHPNVVSQPVDGWVGSCDVTVSGCTEYRDPEEVLTSAGEIASANYADNGSFEDFIGTPNPGYASDGIVDTNLPDIFDFWSNRQTVAGRCVANPGTTCNTDANCPGADTCDTSTRVACGNRLHAVTDSFSGNTAVSIRSYDICGKSAAGATYQCVNNITRVATGVNCPNGDTDCGVNEYCQGDAALYTWYGFDAESLTDNRAFTVSFNAKLDPTDTDCNPTGANDDIFFQLVRTIDNRPFPEGQTDYRPGHNFDVGSGWAQYEGSIRFDSVAAGDWYNTSGPVEDLQNNVSMVIRRGQEAPGMCNVIVDNFRIYESLQPIDYVPYYYIEDTVDTTSCNGLVNREEGCRLFNDTSNTDLPWSSADTLDGQTPELCTDPDDCDANTIVNVRRDRECKRWLECETTLVHENAEGQKEELCLSRYVCDELDPQTGSCISASSLENVNQTFTTPAFAEKIKNYSGLVVAGLDWERRCENDTTIKCTSDAQCGGGTCSEPQIVQGYRPYSEMTQEGSISTIANIIENGDFGDSDYDINQQLSCRLTGGKDDCSPLAASETINSNPPQSIRDGDPEFIENWVPRPNTLGHTASLQWTEVDVNNGNIPSPNSSFDENNVLWVAADGQFTGAQYQLQFGSVIPDQQYTVSARVRWAIPPSTFDKLLVTLNYSDDPSELGQTQWVSDPLDLTESWQDIELGPITSGYSASGTALPSPVSFSNVSLGFVHYYDDPAFNFATDTAPAIEFFIDDVSMKPILAAQFGTCAGAGSNDGKQCSTRYDCVSPGFEGATCEGETNISRDCRLYPQSDAPYCNYVDENNIIHRGWSGYCVERDPQFDKYCISWWPVDLIRGESDVFDTGTLPLSRYSERVPLFECLAAEARAPLVVNAGNFIGTHDNASGDRTFDMRSYNLYLGEIESVVFTAEDGGAGSDWPGSDVPTGDWDVCTDADSTDYDNYTWPYTTFETNRANGRHGCYVDEDNSCPTGGSTPTPWETYWCGGLHGFSFRCDQNENNCNAMSYDWNSFRNYTTDNDNCADLENSEDTNLFQLRPFFDSTTGQLLEIQGALCDSSPGDGSINVTVTVNFRPHCSVLAQGVTRSGQNRVWSSRVDSSTLYGVPDLLYEYTQDFAPFGGVAEPASTQSCSGRVIDRSDPTTWDSSCFPSEYGYNPLYVQEPIETPSTLNINYPPGQVRAGSPYSCDDAGRCGAGRCWDGAVYGASCTTDLDCCTNYQLAANGEPIGCNDDPKQVCEGFVYTPGATVPEGQPTSRVNATPAVDSGLDYLQRLFAISFGVWEYSGGRYAETASAVSIRDAWSDAYQFMSPCPNNVRPTDPAQEYCGVTPTVREASGGTIQLPDQGGVANLRLEVKADRDQEPITYIEVDFGDDSPTHPISGQFASGTLAITHQYSSPGTYQPKVKVVDNWQWCAVGEGEDCGAAGYDCRYQVDSSDCSSPGDPNGFVDSGITVVVGGL